MTVVRAQVSYPTLTGLARDVQQNVLHLFSAAGTRTEVANAFMANFADVVDAHVNYMSDDIFDTTFTVDFFDLEEPEPRVPFTSADFVGNVLAGSGSMPLEATMVISFSGPPVSGGIPARRRGRIFLPTPITAAVDSAAGLVTWDAAYVTAMANAFESFAEGLSAASPSVQLVVYSPTADEEGATLEQSLTIVDRCWVDDEPDTQRRRGRNTGAKTLRMITV
jgi:hypothetical protein